MMASSSVRGGSCLGIRMHFFCGRAVAQVAQGGGGVTIPGGAAELWRCGTEGHGQ